MTPSNGHGDPQPSLPNHMNDQLQEHDQYHGCSILNGGSSNFHQISTSPLTITKENGSICDHNSASQKKYEEEEHKTKKTSPASKPRLMQKTVTESGSKTIRVCADCNTTTTPLWRGGPKGPKSLCNACGIRRRKQRKLMAEVSVAAANGLPVTEASSTKNNRRHTKEKRRPDNHLAQKKSRSAAGAATCTSQLERKLSLKDFAIWSHNSGCRQAFPRDEVADAAVLLMELSCGFAHL